MCEYGWIIPTLLVIACGCAGPRHAVAELKNPSFEQAKGDAPADWKPHTWQGKGQFVYAETARTGKRSVMIASEAGGDLSWETFVVVRPWSTYRLSGWIKTEDVKNTTGKGALFNVHQLDRAHTPPLTGTHDWTRVQVEFETGERDTIQVNCLFGGWGLSTGKAWYDDVQLELIETKPLKPAITIDAAKTREAIHPYIYGQFIEHLGRCIYGGIWAEMVQDRKFFHPVGGKESPWKVDKQGAARITMEKEDSFVGEHTPVFEGQGNDSMAMLSQSGLGAVEGREVVGYVVIAREGDAKCSVCFEGAGAGACLPIQTEGKGFEKRAIRYKPSTTSDDYTLKIQCWGKGKVRIGTVSLMPADNIQGMRADTLALLKQLDSPIYRWPGGNFVSGYDWRDGIGPRDKRPPRKNPAWKGIDSNDFGLDEFIVFCREIRTEPLIVVNTGKGDLDMALKELEYANGTPDTPMGRLRAKNGHRPPYNVTWWGIGNEMYGNWQIGHMPLEDYVQKHNAFVAAMRKQDPSIKVVAVGAAGPWSETMMVKCADHMDMISEHFYCRDKPGLYSHVRQVPMAIRHKARAHRKYRREIPGLAEKDIDIAMDEWNLWYGPHIYGELGVRYYLRDALAIAAGLNEYTRHTDIISMANYAQTVNVIGCIKTTKTAAGFATTGLPLMLYRKHYGTIPVAVEGDMRPLDVAAAWTKNRESLTIAVVNPMRQAFELPFTLQGATLAAQGKRWVITGDDPMAYNVPGKPPCVDITEEACGDVAKRLSVPPLSVVLYALPVR